MLLILVLRPMAIRTGLLDVPNERSSHQRPTPLIGGVAIYLAVGAAYSIPAAIGLVPINRVFASFFVAGLILVSVGLMDDYIRLSTLGKFAAQIIASLLMIYGGGVVLTDLGAMTFSGTTVELGWFSVPFTVFATLGVINALNMSDGLDGLSGTLSLISLTGLMIAAIFGGAFSEAFILVLLAASIFGFLLFNFRVPGRKRAAVFMGDAGSMFIGFSLTWFAIALAQGPDRVMTPAAALWFLMLPIFDTVAMMFRRIIRRRSPFAPDKEHVHHIFLMAGFDVNETVAIMAAAALIGVGIGLLSMGLLVPEISVAGLFVVAGLFYMWMILRAWKVMRFIERSICRRTIVPDRRSTTERRIGSDANYNGVDRRSGDDRRIHQRRRIRRESTLER